MNMALMERASNMLNKDVLEKNFRVEVAATVCYLINRYHA